MSALPASPTTRGIHRAAPRSVGLRALRHPRLVLALAAALACSGDLPTAPTPGPLPGADEVRAMITCVADVRAGTIGCAPATDSGLAGTDSRTVRSGRSADIVIGGQNLYVRLAAGHPTTSGEVYSFTTTLTNLIAQPLGTSDGTTLDPDAVRVFFQSGPVATSGSGTVDFADPHGGSLADGTATFTAANQPYFRFGSIIPQNGSASRLWRFHLPASVTSFAFTVYVSAMVPHPEGYVDVTPAAPTLRAGGTTTLSSVVRTAVGNADGNQSVTWASSNTGVATVSGSGVVTAVADGQATITATAGARTGAALVTVSTASGATTTISGSGFAAGGSTPVTVQVRNAAGAARTVGGDTVQLVSDRGTIGAVTDNGDGTYTATLSSTTAGTAHVTGTVNGQAIDAAHSATITITSAVLSGFVVEAAGGGAIGLQRSGTPFDVRVTARDSYGNTVTSFTGTANITAAGGTLSAGGGTSAAFTAGVLTTSVTVVADGSVTLTATRTGGSETGTSASFTVDTPPTVTSTSPANGATDVALGSTLTVTFSKSVTAGTGSFQLRCPSGSANLPFSVSASPATTYTITPTSSFDAGVSCELTVLAAGVTDASGVSPAANTVATFTTAFSTTADSYPQTVIGNVSVSSASIPYSVTSNDAGGSSSTITFAGYGGTAGATQHGGTVAMTTSGANRGQFTYDPPAGFSGTDQFSYTLSSGAASSTATVTLTVSAPIWFVNNAGGCTTACDGRLSHPFTSLSGFQAVNDGSGVHPAAGQTVFLYQSGTAYTGPVTLLNGQKLVGQDASSTLASLAGVTVPSGSTALPAMQSGDGTLAIISGGSGAVTLASGASATIRGVTLSPSGGDAIGSGSSFGTLTFANGSSETADVTINATGSASALRLQGGTVSGALAGLSSTSSSASVSNVSLTSVAGSLSATSGAIANSGSAAAVSVTGASTLDFTLPATIAKTTVGTLVTVANHAGGTITLGGALSCLSSCSGISLSGNTGGTIAFTAGTKTITPAGGVAVSAANNTGATINFSGGGLAITSSSATGFSASGGGTVNVTGSGNTISSVSGVALSVANTTIGTGGLVFQSISSSGAANGIYLNTTGTSGGLVVAGNGGTCARSNSTCTGGSIIGSNGAGGTTSGIGVYLNSTLSPSLTRMRIGGAHTNFGLYATSVTNLTLATVLMDGTYGDAGDSTAHESAIDLENLAGTGSITDSYVSGGYWNNVYVAGTSGVALNRLTLDRDSLGNTTAATSGNTTAYSMFVGAAAGTTNVTVQNSFLLGGAMGNLLGQWSGGTMDAVATNNTFRNQQSSSQFRNIYLRVNAASGSTTGTGSYTIANNNIRGGVDFAIRVTKFKGNYTLTGGITGNTIGAAGTGNAATTFNGAAAIALQFSGLGKHKALIQSNTLSYYSGNAGIELSTFAPDVGGNVGQSGSMHYSLLGNTLTSPNTAVDYIDGVDIKPGSGGASDGYTMCLKFGGSQPNNLSGSYRNGTDAGSPYAVGPIDAGSNFLKIFNLGASYTGANAATPVDNRFSADNGNFAKGVAFWEYSSGNQVIDAGTAGGQSCDLF